jgi:hypothetical protein
MLGSAKSSLAMAFPEYALNPLWESTTTPSRSVRMLLDQVLFALLDAVSGWILAAFLSPQPNPLCHP